MGSCSRPSPSAANFLETNGFQRLFEADDAFVAFEMGATFYHGPADALTLGAANAFAVFSALAGLARIFGREITPG